MTGNEMIEEFVCPGCVGGMDTKCKNQPCIQPVEGPNDAAGVCCEAHVLGASILGVGTFALGLPKGFNRAGFAGNGQKPEKQRNNTMFIRCWPVGNIPKWDKFNVPVWALEKDGFLFVRTYQPRINFMAVDVVEKGTLDLVPGAIDVSIIHEDMD
jgi:hypothetical protein